jgi:hypothetical protein
MEGLPARAEIDVRCCKATRRRHDLESSIRRRNRRRIIGEWALHRQDGIFGTDSRPGDSLINPTKPFGSAVSLRQRDGEFGFLSIPRCRNDTRNRRSVTILKNHKLSLVEMMLC